MKSILIVAIIFLAIKVNAQSANNKLSFSSINSVGLLTGEAGEAASLQTIAGVSAAKWFVGAGTGLDYYAERTIPLFLDVRRNFSQKAKTPFVYTDFGVNFLWLSADQKAQQIQGSSSKTRPYFDAGIGYKIVLKNRSALMFSAGYSVKQTRQSFKSFNPSPFGNENYEHFDYAYRRLIFKLGIEL